MRRYASHAGLSRMRVDDHFVRCRRGAGAFDGRSAPMPCGCLLDSRVLSTIDRFSGGKEMTTSMCMQQRIRQMDGDGVGHAAIARELGISRTTVVKYANMEDLSPRPRGSAGSRSRVARYADVIEGWLLDDLRMPRKQRHTAQRVYERLLAECGYEGAYPSVQRWVKHWHEVHRAEGERFAAHYGIETRFCSPYSGHEKGSVKNAAGLVPRNQRQKFVPRLKKMMTNHDFFRTLVPQGGGAVNRNSNH